MTAKVSNPMPEGSIRPKAPAAPPPKKLGFSAWTFVEGVWTDVTPKDPITLSPDMQALADRWAGTPHGEFLFPKAEVDDVL